MFFKSRPSSPIRCAVLETLETRRLLAYAVPNDYVVIGGATPNPTTSNFRNITSGGVAVQLQPGENYIAVATGVARIANDNRLADAQYAQNYATAPAWTELAANNPLVFDGTSNAWTGGNPGAGDHTFGKTISPTSTLTARVRFADSQYNDNSYAESVSGYTTADRLRVSLYQQIKLTALTVFSDDNAANNAVDDGIGAEQLFVEEGSDHKASVDLSGIVNINTSAAKSKAIWRIDEANASISQGSFGTVSNHVELTVVNNDRVWNVKAGVDANGNENLDDAEVTHTVKVSVMDIGDVTASEAGSPFNELSVTASEANAEVDLYVFETASGYGVVNFVATIAPDEDAAKDMVLWQMFGDDAAPSGGDLGDLGDVFLTPTAANREYTFELGFDTDDDGLLDSAEVDRTVDVTVVLLHVEEINFKGGGIKDIQINATTDMGHPVSGTGEDIEWVRGTRDQPLTSSAWANNQIGPVLNVLLNPMMAEVKFSVLPTTVSNVIIYGASDGAYSDFGIQQVVFTGGTGKATFTSAGVAPFSNDVISVDDFSVQWELAQINGFDGHADLDRSDHRVYSVFDTPVNSQVTPWAEVLEFSTNLAAGASDSHETLTALTEGLYFSKWKGKAANIRFNASAATSIYNPALAPRVQGIATATNSYNITSWLADINAGGGAGQQCADNADLLATMSHSLGINMAPTYISATFGLPAATYLGAGNAINSTIAFNYHQVGFFGGKVYDPSTGYPQPAGGGAFTPAPFILDYDTYLGTAFGTTRDDVSDLRVTNITVS